MFDDLQHFDVLVRLRSQFEVLLVRRIASGNSAIGKLRRLDDLTYLRERLGVQHVIDLGNKHDDFSYLNLRNLWLRRAPIVGRRNRASTPLRKLTVTPARRVAVPDRSRFPLTNYGSARAFARSRNLENVPGRE